MQHQYNNFYKHFYKNSKGQIRQHGIFAPGVDRFILIDDHDFWITLETAEILSSKIPTMVYMLPPLNDKINNLNCIHHTILNKTQQKVGSSPLVVSRQQPMLKFLYDQDEIVDLGIPEDYKDPIRKQMLQQLQDFAIYVHKNVFAIRLTEAFYNPVNNLEFAKKYISPEWTANMKLKVDRSELENGVFFQLRSALYLSSSIDEVEKRIINIWNVSPPDQVYLMVGFYKILNRPIPTELASRITMLPESFSPWLF